MWKTPDKHTHKHLNNEVSHKNFGKFYFICHFEFIFYYNHLNLIYKINTNFFKPDNLLNKLQMDSDSSHAKSKGIRFLERKECLH